MLNAITYDISKTKAVFFSKSHRQRLSKQLRETKLKVGDKQISFHKEATQWLEVGLIVSSNLHLILIREQEELELPKFR